MDLTLEILNNKEKYPDDRAIVLGDGETITCGELRDKLQPRSAFTQASQKWAERERELQAAHDGLSQQLAALQQQLQAYQQQAAPPSSPTPGSVEERRSVLRQDPYFSVLMEEIDALKQEREAARQRLDMHERYVKTREYEARLGALESRWNSRFNKDGKRPWDKRGFLEFVQKNPILSYNGITQTQDVDLETTYDKWAWNEEIGQREREAEERGFARGKQQATVPPMPFGRRRGTPQKSKDLPETFGAVTDEMLLQDPEIIEAMTRDAGA